MMRLLVVFVLFLTFSSQAQEGKGKGNGNSGLSNFTKPNEVSDKGAVLYSNDFSNGSTWSFSNTSVPSADWQITTNLNLAPINAFHPAGFLTAWNGYAIINSDAQGPTATQDAYLNLNTVITACANKPFVLLRFSQMLRRFNDTTTVEVSNNGTTWTEFWCNPNLVNNLNTPNPQKVDINISSVAGNQDTVYIRFRYRAADAWFWAIDDVKIVEQDQYDLEGLETTFGSTGNWGIRMPYHQIPIEQIAPIAITGRVKNAGYAGQTDVFLSGNSTGGYSSTSIPELIGPNAFGVIDLPDLWTPNASLGLQSVTLSVGSSATDQEPSNNTLPQVKVTISPKFYARSTDIRTGRVSNNFYTEGYETGNIFDIFADATISSAMVHVNAETTPGAKLFAKLYEANSQGNFTLLSLSDTLSMPTMNNDQVFRVRLRNPTLLEAGKSYLLTAGSLGSSTFPGLVMGTSGISEIFTSYFKGANSSTWYSFTEAPMVKMNFESVMGLADHFVNEKKLSLYPNPAKNTVYLQHDVQEGGEIDFMNAQGKVISSRKMEPNLTPISFDISDLSDGWYFMRVKTDTLNRMLKLFIQN